MPEKLMPGTPVAAALHSLRSMSLIRQSVLKTLMRQHVADGHDSGPVF